MKPWICDCGHNRSWHHRNQWRGEYCTLCADCSRVAAEHIAGGHDFKQCKCEAAA